MNTLEITNQYSWLHSNDNELKSTLWELLRCRSKNYYHNVRYKMKLWDGFFDFFTHYDPKDWRKPQSSKNIDKNSGRFLTGLLPEVRLVLKKKDIPYEVVDRRKLFHWAVEEINNQFLNNGPNPVKELRDYQVDYTNQVIKNYRGLITSPTASGKTNTMKAIIKALPPKTPTLVLANKKGLVDQNYEEIKSLGIDWVGRLYGDEKEPNFITCSTVQSAHLLKPILPKIKVLIVDEVHEMMSKVPKRIYNACKEAVVRVGMSATAFKFGGKDESQKFEVKGYFGPIFLTHSTESGKLTTKELIDREILSSAYCTFYRITEPQIPYAIYIDAVTQGIAENEYFHKKVVQLVKKLEGRTLVIVERLEHGDRLHELLPGSMWIRGEDKLETRNEVIDKLKNETEDIVAIATSGIFNTGINVFCHNLINAAGGQADHQIIQRFGRGLRRASDKQHLRYYDFIFEINDYLHKHSLKRIKILEKEGHSVEIKQSL